MMYRVGAIVVLYNPTKDNIEYINKIMNLNLFDYIRIWDNSKKNNGSFWGSVVDYHHSEVNLGLAKPYNDMIEFCLKNKYDYLCILDQDSYYSGKEILSMITHINEKKYSEEVTICAPRSYSHTSKKVERGENVTQVLYAINSGSFLNLRSIEKYNLRYDENIFLDGLDYEFGLQIRNKGCKVYIYENSILKQNLGYCEGHIKYNRHSAYRYYYIVHNRKYILKKHHGAVTGWIISSTKTIVLIIKILRYEDDKIGKIKKSIEGWLK